MNENQRKNYLTIIVIGILLLSLIITLCVIYWILHEQDTTQNKPDPTPTIENSIEGSNGNIIEEEISQELSELDINSELVQNLYKLVNPVECGRNLFYYYCGDGINITNLPNDLKFSITLNNISEDHLITDSSSNLYLINHKIFLETYHRIFGKNMDDTWFNQPCTEENTSYCYNEENNITTTFSQVCGPTPSVTPFLVSAKQDTEGTIFLTIAVAYKYYSLDDYSTVAYYSDFTKLLFEGNEEEFDITLYQDELPHYQLIFKSQNDSYYFASTQRVR